MLVSGGARGADTVWEQQASSHGCKVVHYITAEIRSKSSYDVVIDSATLASTDPFLVEVGKKLGRPYPCRYKYYQQRDFLIATGSQALYAVGVAQRTPKEGHAILDIEGGTAWTVESFKQYMAPNGYHLYFFNQPESIWYIYVGKDLWRVVDKPPSPLVYSVFGGVGSRDIIESGVKAITDVWR